MAKTYESEITQFLQALKTANPGLAAAQKQGRNLLWDQAVDLDFAAAAQTARVAQAPYVYGGAPAWTAKAALTGKTPA